MLKRIVIGLLLVGGLVGAVVSTAQPAVACPESSTPS
jgi:hypothetical protein